MISLGRFLGSLSSSFSLDDPLYLAFYDRGLMVSRPPSIVVTYQLHMKYEYNEMHEYIFGGRWLLE